MKICCFRTSTIQQGLNTNLHPLLQGWFEILTLAGSSVVSGELGTRRRNGLLSVSLANNHGQVFGGTVAGPLVAAGPGAIQVKPFLPIYILT